MAFDEAAQLQAFGRIDSTRWMLYYYQQQQNQDQRHQTQYELEQEHGQILGEDGFPAVIENNELVWQGHQVHTASQENTPGYNYDTQYEYTPVPGLGVPVYDEATAQWHNANQPPHHAHQQQQQQQQQGYYRPTERPHERAYPQHTQMQTPTLAQLHAPAPHIQIQQQQHREEGSMAVKEDAADAQYRAHLALSADAILRGKGGSWCGSSLLIPSSSWEGLGPAQMETKQPQPQQQPESDADEKELEPLPFIVPSQAHLPPTHLLPAYLQWHRHQQQHQYGARRVIDLDAPFNNPLMLSILPLHTSSSSSSSSSSSLSYASSESSPSPSNSSSSSAAAGSRPVSPVKIGPTASLGSALGTVIPTHRGLGRPNLLASRGPNLVLGSGDGSGDGGASKGAAEMGASDEVSERERERAPKKPRQVLACLFCRERKIACRWPEAGSDDPACNQCARRHICCEYPEESRRGQHKRTRKRKFGHGAEMGVQGRW